MMCDMFIFKEIRFLPRGYRLGRGWNYTQMKGQNWFYGFILFSNTFTATRWRNIDF